MTQIFTKQLDYGASIVSDPTGKFRVEFVEKGVTEGRTKSLMHQVEREERVKVRND